MAVNVYRVKASLAEVAGRVKEIRKSGGQTLVLFYYSGHGSAEALHIIGKRWRREEVTRAVEGLGSGLEPPRRSARAPAAPRAIPARI